MNKLNNQFDRLPSYCNSTVLRFVWFGTTDQQIKEGDGISRSGNPNDWFFELEKW